MRSRVSLVAIAAVVVGSLSKASIAALILSGGGSSGQPLSITLTDPITYTITATTAVNQAPFFTFDDLGIGFGNSALTTPLAFTVNGITGATITRFGAGTLSNQTTLNVGYLYGSFTKLNVGDVVVLEPGVTSTTTSGYDVVATTGFHLTRLTDANAGALTDSSSVTVTSDGTPEPSGPITVVCVVAAVLCRRFRVGPSSS